MQKTNNKGVIEKDTRQKARSMNAITDEDVRVMSEASDAYWDSDAANQACGSCRGDGLVYVDHDPDACAECHGMGSVCIGTEQGAMRAAAEALLSRRQVTRERLRGVARDTLFDVAAGMPHEFAMRSTADVIADAIYADLFGVTD